MCCKKKLTGHKGNRPMLSYIAQSSLHNQKHTQTYVHTRQEGSVGGNFRKRHVASACLDVHVG